ncbi:hypothetical protein JHK82_055371 [Glycine max]|nr:hypothetical protein JHK86_055209 [Glycine max]KAG5076676.1 hypothetical protein JHK82_055371 [Glycine max]
MKADMPLGWKLPNLERYDGTTDLDEYLDAFFTQENLNEVRQVGQKRDKREGGTRTDLHKSDKQRKPNKCQLLPRGPKYECYTPLMTNRTIILEEAFNTEVPIMLPLPLPYRPRDFKGINPINQDDLMVFSIVSVNFMVSKVLIDQGSSTNILYWKTFQRLEVSSNTVQPYSRPLLGFARERVETRVYVNLMTTFDQGQLSKSFTTCI